MRRALAPVRLGRGSRSNTSAVRGRLSSSLAYGQKATLEVYGNPTWDDEEEEYTYSGTGNSRDVYGWLLSPGDELPMNTDVIAISIGGYLEVVSAACPESY